MVSPDPTHACSGSGSWWPSARGVGGICHLDSSLTNPPEVTMPDGAAAGEREIEVLLEDDQTFEPPPEFAAQANANDPSIYEEAEGDFQAWWERWADQLHWFDRWEKVLEWN